MKGTTIFFLSILLITTGCKRLDQTADDLITVDVTNNSFPISLYIENKGK